MRSRRHTLIAMILLVASVPSSSIGQVEPPKDDGTKRLLGLPFFPHTIRIAPNGKWFFITREEYDHSLKKHVTHISAINLPSIQGKKTDTKLRVAKLGYYLSENMVIVPHEDHVHFFNMELEETKKPAPDALGISKLLLRKWRTKKMRRKAPKRDPGPFGRSYGSNFRSGQFVYDSLEPDKPIWFYGSHYVPGESTAMRIATSGDPRSPRVASTRSTLASAQLWREKSIAYSLQRAPREVLTTPFEFPQSNTMKNPKWFRILALDRAGFRAGSAHLFGQIRFTANSKKHPIWRFLENSELDPNTRSRQFPASGIGGKFMVAIGENALLVEFDKETVAKFPESLDLNREDAPLYLDYSKPAEWQLQVASGGEKLKQVTFEQGSHIRFAARDQIMRIDVPAWYKERGRAQITKYYREAKLKRASFENQLKQLREECGPSLAAIEAMTDHKIAGLPLTLPFLLNAVCESGATFKVAGCFVVNVPPAELRTVFDNFGKPKPIIAAIPPKKPEPKKRPPVIVAKKESKKPDSKSTKASGRIATESKPKPISVVESKPLTAKDVGLSEAETATSPRESLAIASTRYVGAMAVPIKCTLNFAATTLIGALFLWWSCRLFSDTAEQKNQIKVPSFVSLLVLMSVLAGIMAAIELLPWGWAENAVLSRGWSPIWTLGLFLIVAMPLRLLIVGLAVAAIYRFSRAQTMEVMKYFASMGYTSAFVVGCAMACLGLVVNQF